MSPRRWRLVAIAVLVAVGGALAAGFLADTTPGSSPSALPALPLKGSVELAGGDVATLDMGRTEGAENFFWQLFVEDPNGRWRLATPPGVADNGGLVIAADSHTLVAGFEPSQELTFSPLAVSTTWGRTWSPGGLDVGLRLGASVLAIAPPYQSSGAVARAVALSRSHVASLYALTGGWTAWSPSGSPTGALTLLTPSESNCSASAVDAVALGPDEVDVGVTCANGKLPIERYRGDAYLGPVIARPNDLGTRTEVLRLSATETMLATRIDGHTAVVAGWRASATSDVWDLSPPLTVEPGWRIVSTGDGPGETQFAEIRRGDVAAALTIDPKSSWITWGQLPRGTQTVAWGTSGSLEALSADGRVMTVWSLTPRTARWRAVQTIAVPIVYGSSS